MFTVPILTGPLPRLRLPPARQRSCLRPAWRWALCLAGLTVSSALAAVSTAYQVKAAFLFNFTKFVEWPAERFASPDAPIVLAVLGRNPFDDELENLVRDRLVDGRPVVVRRLATVEEAKTAGATIHLLFIPAGEESHFAALDEFLPRGGILTVGESDRFAALGGMMNFVVVENRVRFEINRAAVAAADLKLRAQLLKLAVPARPPGGGTAP